MFIYLFSIDLKMYLDYHSMFEPGSLLAAFVFAFATRADRD